MQLEGKNSLGRGREVGVRKGRGGNVGGRGKRRKMDTGREGKGN